MVENFKVGQCYLSAYFELGFIFLLIIVSIHFSLGFSSYTFMWFLYFLIGF